MRKLRTAAAVILVSTGGLATAGGVLAQPAQTPPSPDTIAPPTATLPSQDRAAAGICEGKTFNPHNSKHFPGDVSVSARTTCPGYAVTVTVYLYKKVNGSWRFLDS